MSFSADVTKFRVKLGRLVPAVYVGVATRAHQSIVGTGQPDPITGAPGQPVDTGFLRDSWTLAIGKDEARIQTNVAYARVIEDNNRAAYDPKGEVPDRKNPDGSTRPSVKSTKGGSHSVKLTIAGASAIQAAVVREVVG